MNSFLTLTRREVRSVFVSPMAYGTAAVFLFLFGLFFWVNFTRSRLVEVQTVIYPLGYILPVLLAPVLTMRLLAEERRQGTLEMLLTAPVRDLEVVCSKFAGVMLFYFSIVALTGFHIATMVCFYDGRVDWGSFFAGYLGMLLSAGLFLSVGLFTSSLFETPLLGALVAFVGGMTVLSADFIMSSPLFLDQGSNQLKVLQFLMPFPHYKNFLDGVIDSRDVAYFACITCFFLFLTTKALESRKWS